MRTDFIKLAPKVSKFHNTPYQADGFDFGSKAEWKRYEVLKEREKRNLISSLEVHPLFDIVIRDVKICAYIADFSYQKHGEEIIEDVKCEATVTGLFKLKKKLVKAVLGKDVTEIFYDYKSHQFYKEIKRKRVYEIEEN